MLYFRMKSQYILCNIIIKRNYYKPFVLARSNYNHTLQYYSDLPNDRQYSNHRGIPVLLLRESQSHPSVYVSYSLSVFSQSLNSNIHHHSLWIYRQGQRIFPAFQMFPLAFAEAGGAEQAVSRHRYFLAGVERKFLKLLL